MEESTEELQLEALKSSGLLAEFVRSTGGNWSSGDLEDLMAKIKELNVTVSLEKIGAVLESERVAYAQKIVGKEDGGEATVNFDELGLRRKREYLECEIRRRIR